MFSIRTPVLAAVSCVLIRSIASAQTAPPAAGPVSPLMPMTAPGTTLPAAPSPDETAVRAALEKYNSSVASGDVKALTDFVVVGTPQQTGALALMARLTTVGRAMYDATAAKFGEKELAADNVDRASFPAGFPALPADQLDVRVTGDRASLVVRTSAEAPPLSMKKINDQWKLDGDALLPAMTDKQLTEQSQVLTAAMGAIEQTTADVTAGHFRAADEAVAVMNLRVQKAVRIAQTKLAAIDEASTPTTGPAATTVPAK